MIKYAIIAILLILSHYSLYYLGSKKPPEIVEKQIVKRDIVTRTVETIKPNGEKEIVTVISDQSKISDSKSSKTSVQSKYLLGGNYNVSASTYGVAGYIRVIGPVWAGVGATPGRELTVNLLVEF
jgi:hypothetical protein